MKQPSLTANCYKEHKMFFVCLDKLILICIVKSTSNYIILYHLMHPRISRIFSYLLHCYGFMGSDKHLNFMKTNKRNQEFHVSLSNPFATRLTRHQLLTDQGYSTNVQFSAFIRVIAHLWVFRCPNNLSCCQMIAEPNPKHKFHFVGLSEGHN